MQTFFQAARRWHGGRPGCLVAGDIDALGFRNLEGRNPKSADEVSIGVNTAREFGLGIGDTYGLYVGGERLDLQIVGLFQTLNNGGTGFRIGLDAVRRANPMHEPEPVRRGPAGRRGPVGLH